MSMLEAPPGVRPLIVPVRWLLYAASALVFLAGLQLTVFTEQTAMFFAWTIARPLTGAFLGASYWAAVPVEVIAARQSSWANARVAVPAIWLFLAPDFVKQIWPWGLTPLTARAIGAWLIGIGLAALHASRENDFLRIRPLAGGYIAFSVLQFIAVARYAGDVKWSAPAAWVYLA